ncbi:hypothetical protein [Oceaniradius stylonematis]|uniref:hypothetical protein n=1 Tax=Oceaniradius stylonematis TaxID=2184161 RepID=UPI003C7DE2FC
MLARTPWVKPQRVKAKPRRMNRNRKRRLIAEVCMILKTGEPTKFAFEGACRHGLRSALCLEGWQWAEADRVAAEIVSVALNIIGARRPTWQEGQPEWTQPGAMPIERERCKRCAKPLPESRTMFCSDLCRAAEHNEKAVERRRSNRMVEAHIAIRVSGRK